MALVGAWCAARASLVCVPLQDEEEEEEGDDDDELSQVGFSLCTAVADPCPLVSGFASLLQQALPLLWAAFAAITGRAG